MAISREMIDALKSFATPSITNVVATYPESPLCLGLYNPWMENWYTDQSTRCMYPEIGPVVGHAVTCVNGLLDPTYSRLNFLHVVEALDASPKPTELVFQQKFPPENSGKIGLSGGNMTSAMKAVGCVRALCDEETNRMGALKNASSAAEVRAIFTGQSYTKGK